MTLYFIGLGLWDEKDISVKGLEVVRRCDYVYLDHYTSFLNCDIKDLERVYGKEIKLANRDLVEKKAEAIIERAKVSKVAFLVVGDPFAATTHIDLMLRARKEDVKIKIVHNASILSAIGFLGLELYKYGKVTSIPFENKNIKTPYEVYLNNKEKELHTLFLLDLDLENKKFMTVNDGVKFLIDCGLEKDTLCVGVGGVGSDEPEIKIGKAKEIIKRVFVKYPQCFIIPSNMHFMEEEVLGLWK